MDQKNKSNHPVSVGLDIGTTTISAAVLNIESGSLIKTFTVLNSSSIKSETNYEHIQSSDIIWETVKDLTEKLFDEYDIRFIGVTGQMHGIMYISPDGSAISPLYTWQDGRAGQGDDSACKKIKQLTGYSVPEGYGFATHYYLSLEDKIPSGKYYCCTIMDYITLRLCNLDRPIMHISDAASWGLFDADKKDFDYPALEKLGIDKDSLPLVTQKICVVGKYNGVPVSVAIGDCQAAFMGSVNNNENAVLVNIGTGSQVSVLSNEPITDKSGLIESRPFDERRFLICGSALCGGRAYALLEKFFRQYAVACGMSDENQYDVMNSLAKEGVESGSSLRVKTTFCGTRANPLERGSIEQIGENDFTPQALTAGVLNGMADELYEMYQLMPKEAVRTLIASGNAVRKNPVLRKILENKFRLPLEISENSEEAACGASLTGAKYGLF